MNRKGITLIEILVVLTILSILTLSLYTAFKTGVDTWNKAKSKLEIYQNARVALDLMSRELASAVAIDSVRSFKGTSGGLSFLMMGEDSIREVTYTMSGNTLVRRYEENADYDFNTGYGTGDVAYKTSSVGFKYWDSGTTAWESGSGETPARDNWTHDWTSTGLARYDLPRAVKIKLTDSEEGRPLETVVYIPYSESD